MSVKMPSLFDDELLFQYEKGGSAVPEKEDKQPAKEKKEPGPEAKNKVQADPEEVAESNLAEQETETKPEEPVTEAEAETVADVKDALNDKTDESESEAAPEKPEEPVAQKIRKPALELPESKEEDVLKQQLLQEVIQTDYASFIQKDYPFDPGAIEIVSPAKNKVIEKEAAPEEAETEEPDHKPLPALPKWDLKKNYYTIGEVARLFEVNISHIRFWTNEFKLKLRTTRKGDRLYTPEQIEELRLVHYLVKVKKHTLKGAKEKLKTQRETVENNLGLKDSLIRLRDLLLAIRGRLDE